MYIGITSKTYKLRADILSNIFGTSTSEGNVKLVNCQCSVGYITNKTLINCPSIEQRITCLNKCINQRKTINIFLIEDSNLKTEIFNNIINDYLTLKTSKLCQICNSNTTAKVTAAGKFYI